MDVDELRLGSHLDLAGIEPVVVGSFAGQRRRLLEITRGLTDEQWATTSRCSEWDLHGLVLHVLGATNACRETLTGERPVFDGAFDPNSSPNAFVDSRTGQTPAATRAELDTSIADAVAVIDGKCGKVPAPRVTAVWGEEVDWRLFVTHMFWDGWMHERDLLVPLGREPEVEDSEARLAVSYGLHSAAIMIGLLGAPFDATLHLEGPGGGTYRIQADGLEVVISSRPRHPGDGPIDGETVAVSDAIAGRGPELHTVLGGDPAVVAALAQLGEFLRGQSPAPPLPD